MLFISHVRNKNPDDYFALSIFVGQIVNIQVAKIRIFSETAKRFPVFFFLYFRYYCIVRSFWILHENRRR